MNTTERPYFAGLLFMVILAASVGLIVGAAGTWAADQASVEPIPATALAWRQGDLPVGSPVVGLWIHEGELVTMAVIRTDYAGLYEFSLVGRQVRPLPDPDYWAPMPEVHP